VARNFANVENAMRRAIERGQRQGEIDPDKDPYALARFMLTMIQGIRVVGKATPERPRLEDAIDVALGALE
jgi:TetR/AcrR family transcriptional repressor of nem operon